MPYNFNFNFIKNEVYPNTRNGSSTWISPDNKYLYLFGGSENDCVYDDFLKYDIKKNKWEIIENKDNKPQERFGAIHFTYNNKFYLISGFGKKDTLQDFWTFDLTNNKWTNHQENNSKLIFGSYSSYWLVENKLYYFGGLCIDKKNSINLNDKLIIYNLDNHDLKILDSPCINPRFNANFWSYKINNINYLYLLHGMSLDKDGNFKQLQDMWKFNCQELLWEKINTIPNNYKPKNACLKFQLDKKIYLFGGINSDNQLYNQLWRFKPKDNSFKLIKNIKNIPSPRADSAIWKKENEIYIFGGLGQKYHLNDFWKLNIIKRIF